jgi:chloramphenicol 3-O phosphotransferase
MSGRIVLLNGAPRAGKSSIAAALQASAEGAWINLGVDSVMATLPEPLRPGLGLRPGGERPDLEPLVQQQYGALFDSIAAQARNGFDIVADVGIHDSYSRPLGILQDAVQRLAGLPVLFVGVRCPIETIMARRNADPRGGYYAAGDSVPAPVLRWQEAVHAGKTYDLELDTSVLLAGECAAAIAVMIQSPPDPGAFNRLRRTAHR